MSRRRRTAGRNEPAPATPKVTSPTNRGGATRRPAERTRSRRSGTSPTTRPRRTRQDVARLKDQLVEIVEEIKPCSVRQVYYQAVSRGLIPKTEQAYKSVICRLLKDLRLEKRIPFRSIADSTRWVHRRRRYQGLEALRQDMARTYRRDLWRDQPVDLEIWCEKDALAGVLFEETDRWGVGLYVTRGYASLSYLAEAADEISESGKPTFIYYLGDHDPSGLDIPRAVERRLRQLAPDAEIHFERVAVTLEQIEALDLPTRPTKKSDSRAKGFGHDQSVELDAIPPDELRRIVSECIEGHVDHDALAATKHVERLERETLRSLRMPQIGLSEDDHAY